MSGGTGDVGGMLKYDFILIMIIIILHYGQAEVRKTRSDGRNRGRKIQNLNKGETKHKPQTIVHGGKVNKAFHNV